MERLKKEKKYTGFGLIEAILAIAVAGIASMVFLRLAYDNWLDVIQVEQSDAIAKESIKTAQQVRIIVEDHNNRDNGAPRKFPALSGLTGRCSRVIGTLETPEFEDLDFYECSTSDLSTCKTNSSGDYYSIYCVQSVDMDMKLVEGVIISGLKSCKVKEDKGDVCDVPEFRYTLISNLKD